MKKYLFALGLTLAFGVNIPASYSSPVATETKRNPSHTVSMFDLAKLPVTFAVTLLFVSFFSRNHSIIHSHIYAIEDLEEAWFVVTPSRIADVIAFFILPLAFCILPMKKADRSLLSYVFFLFQLLILVISFSVAPISWGFTLLVFALLVAKFMVNSRNEYKTVSVILFSYYFLTIFNMYFLAHRDWFWSIASQVVQEVVPTLASALVALFTAALILRLKEND